MNIEIESQTIFINNYEQLEKEAQEAQTTKARFPGGIWKLYVMKH
jgi:hypothetical protein